MVIISFFRGQVCCRKFLIRGMLIIMEMGGRLGLSYFKKSSDILKFFIGSDDASSLSFLLEFEIGK
jgi:hypothetical protein